MLAQPTKTLLRMMFAQGAVEFVHEAVNDVGIQESLDIVLEEWSKDGRASSMVDDIKRNRKEAEAFVAGCLGLM